MPEDATLRPRRFALPQSPDSQAPSPIIDGCGRRIDHLRLSVTSACNLHCLYCRPAQTCSSARVNFSDAMRLDLVRHLYERRGLRQLRLTGGEPLLHPSILSLIADLRAAAPALTMAMTTNGVRLAELADDLRRAGLDRLNISVDSTDPRRYRLMTRGCLEEVFDGIDAAAGAGFPPPKINAVILKDFNDDQIIPLARWACGRGFEIRFLEAMPIGPAADFNRAHYVPARRMKEILASHFRLAPLGRQDGETALRYAVEDGSVRGTIGIIAPISEPFCGQCRRMRLTADGRLFPCLLDERCVDLSSCWNDAGFSPQAADVLIHQAAAEKAPSGLPRQHTAMVTLGG